MKHISKEGSVRVDLVGGTLDLSPINLILPEVVTLNVATTLTAKVKVEMQPAAQVTFISKDYHSKKEFSLQTINGPELCHKEFEQLWFLAEIVRFFSPTVGLVITTESGSPPGAGLGGSSAMGVTVFSALADFFAKKYSPHEMVMIVKDIEAKILGCGPTGYQDYFPAIFGGILALLPQIGQVQVSQLYSEHLCQTLQRQLTLVYSGDSRLSGINNWEVYKGFFDGNVEIIKGLAQIAEISHATYQAILDKSFDQVAALIGREGEIRRGLFPNIFSPKMEVFFSQLKEMLPHAGMKVCGAGGGGCFLVVHAADQKDAVASLLKKHDMQELEFEILPPKVAL